MTLGAATLTSGGDNSSTAYAGVISGTGVATNGLVSGQGSFAMSGTSLTWTAVPEATSAPAGLLLVAGLLRRRRIKMRSVTAAP